MDRAEGLKIAHNKIAWSLSDINDLINNSFKELSEVKNETIGEYFTIMERSLKEYERIQRDIEIARAQVKVLNAID